MRPRPMARYGTADVGTLGCDQSAINSAARWRRSRAAVIRSGWTSMTGEVANKPASDPLPGDGDGLQRHRRSQRVTGERNLPPDGIEHRQQPLGHRLHSVERAAPTDRARAGRWRARPCPRRRVLAWSAQMVWSFPSRGSGQRWATRIELPAAGGGECPLPVYLDLDHPACEAYPAQVVADVVGVFETDGESHHVLADACLVNCSADIWRWVVLAGWMTRVRTSPTLARCDASRQDSMNRRPASSPFTPNRHHGPRPVRG